LPRPPKHRARLRYPTPQVEIHSPRPRAYQPGRRGAPRRPRAAATHAHIVEEDVWNLSQKSSSERFHPDGKAARTGGYPLNFRQESPIQESTAGLWGGVLRGLGRTRRLLPGTVVAAQPAEISGHEVHRVVRVHRNHHGHRSSGMGGGLDAAHGLSPLLARGQRTAAPHGVLGALASRRPDLRLGAGYPPRDLGARRRAILRCPTGPHETGLDRSRIKRGWRRLDKGAQGRGSPAAAAPDPKHLADEVCPGKRLWTNTKSASSPTKAMAKSAR
jgi:hypothetical protein